MYMMKKLSIMDNIVLPGYQAGLLSRDEVNKKAEELMRRLGIIETAGREITEVSGGQLQRACIARSMINKPEIIFADEPTGALDSKTSVEIMELLKELNERDKLTIIVVTHESGVANYTNKIIHIKDGVIGQIEENRAHDAMRFGSDGVLK